MKVYDADTDLNKLFNLPGLMGTIHNYQLSFVIYTIIEYIPIFLYTGILFLSVKLMTGPLYVLSIFGGYIVMNCIRSILSGYSSMVSCWIRHYNSEIHTIVKNHSNVFNLEYMNFILKQRIDEKKEGNKTVKQIMVFFCGIIGLSTFANHEFNHVIKNGLKEQEVWFTINCVILAFFIAWLIVEAFSNFINDPNSLQNKWGILYESVKQLKLSEKEKS